MKKRLRGTKVKRTVLAASRIRITQNLGNGFRRHVFPQVTLAPGEYRSLIMTAPAERVVISGGFATSAGSNDRVYPTDTYPFSDTQWVIFLKNESSVSIAAVPYLISKRD